MFSFVGWIRLSSDAIAGEFIFLIKYLEQTLVLSVTNLVFTGNLAASLVDNHLLLTVKVSRVQALVLLELLHGLTERDGGRTPGVPGWSTPRHPGLAGLHTLQEVVVLLLLAGLLRSVEEVVFDDRELVVVIGARYYVLP